MSLSFKDIKGKYPREFSGGELQRISITRALLSKPSLIIVDEPVPMIDVNGVKVSCWLYKKLEWE